jgi:serine/threonine protein phosphatase PrpC
LSKELEKNKKFEEMLEDDADLMSYFLLFDKEYCSKLESGATCTITFIKFYNSNNDQKFITLNIGDSRQILVNNSKIVYATEDHKPSNQIEKERVRNLTKIRLKMQTDTSKEIE